MKPITLLLLLPLVAGAQMPAPRFHLNARRITSPIPIKRITRERFTLQPVPSVATVYVASPQGVQAYASTAGVLTPIGGPQAVAGNLVGATATDLITVDAESVYDYAVAIDGSLGAASATAAVQGFSGAQCGAIVNAAVDPRGFVYVQLAGAEDASGENLCNAIQTYKAGALTFEGGTVYDANRFAEAGTEPVASGAFAFNTTAIGQACESEFDAFSRESSGTLDAIQIASVQYPAPDPSGGGFYPLAMTADGAGHLAVAMEQDFDPPCGTFGAVQLASFTVNPDGSLASTNTWQNMPAVDADSNVEAMAIDPTNATLAVAGDGVWLYGFHGGAPITGGKQLLPGAGVGALGWDKAGNLYAWGVDAEGASTIWTVASGAVASAMASPGSAAMVVVPR